MLLSFLPVKCQKRNTGKKFIKAAENLDAVLLEK